MSVLVDGEAHSTSVQTPPPCAARCGGSSGRINIVACKQKHRSETRGPVGPATAEEKGATPLEDAALRVVPGGVQSNLAHPSVIKIAAALQSRNVRACARFAPPSTNVRRETETCQTGSKLHIFDCMGKLRTALSTANQHGIWRVRIFWPNGSINHFGRFVSEAEATKWIAEHDWMTHSTIDEADIRRKEEG
jgi:hypothetical protein